MNACPPLYRLMIADPDFDLFNLKCNGISRPSRPSLYNLGRDLANHIIWNIQRGELQPPLFRQHPETPWIVAFASASWGCPAHSRRYTHYTQVAFWQPHRDIGRYSRLRRGKLVDPNLDRRHVLSSGLSSDKWHIPVNILVVRPGDRFVTIREEKHDATYMLDKKGVIFQTAGNGVIPAYA